MGRWWRNAGSAAVFVVSGDQCRRGRVATGVASMLTGAGVWAGVKAVYVGAHLPLDVAGGAAIGVISGRISETMSEALASVAYGPGRQVGILAASAPLASQLTYWTIAAPAPWSGSGARFSTQ